MSTRTATALIADVVGSREHPDQRALLRALADTAGQVTAAVPSVQAPALTVGDELQAVYDDLTHALDAWLHLRIAAATHPTHPYELRIGIGCGEVEDTGAAPAPAGQSGTAWWRAREALDRVRTLAARSHWPRSLRTQVVTEDDRETGVNAVLLLADELLAGMDPADLTILSGLRAGRTQSETAESIGLSQPAVARRQREKGISALHRALELLQGTGTP